METNEMTPEKSFQIINDAIEKSRKDFEKDAGSPMIFWGYVVLFFSIVVWILLTQTENPQWNFLWFGIPVVGYVLYMILFKGISKSGGKSFISRSIGQIWIAYGIFATVLSAVFAFVQPQLTGYLTVSLLGFSAVMTGQILKNSYIQVGGYVTGLGCTIALFFFQNNFAPLCVAAASILNLIIPGMMMNRRAE